jgi:hypothetical protein
MGGCWFALAVAVGRPRAALVSGRHHNPFAKKGEPCRRAKCARRPARGTISTACTMPLTGSACVTAGQGGVRPRHVRRRDPIHW